MNTALKRVSWVCLCATVAWSDGTLVDRVMGVVGGQPIMRSEVDERARSQLAKAIDAGERARVRREVLDQLIDERLISSDARQLSLSVEDGELEAALDQIAHSMKFSRDELMKAVEAEGSDAQRYRAEVRRQLLEMRWVMARMDRERRPSGDPSAFLAAERARLLSKLRAEAGVELKP